LKTVVESNVAIVPADDTDHDTNSEFSDEGDDESDENSVIDISSMGNHSDGAHLLNGNKPKLGQYIDDISPITPEEATQNVEYLSTQAKSWLAVLFNVFTSVERDGRPMVGDVISAWALIAKEPVCSFFGLLIIIPY
jgi:hypothetical protein